MAYSSFNTWKISLPYLARGQALSEFIASFSSMIIDEKRMNSQLKISLEIGNYE